MSDIDEKLGRILAITEGTRDDLKQIRTHIETQDKELHGLQLKTSEHRTWFKVIAAMAGIGLLGGGSAAASLLKIFN